MQIQKMTSRFITNLYGTGIRSAEWQTDDGRFLFARFKSEERGCGWFIAANGVKASTFADDREFLQRNGLYLVRFPTLREAAHHLGLALGV